MFIAEGVEGFTGGEYLAAVGLIEASLDAGGDAGFFQLILEVGDALLKGEHAGFEFGDGHGRLR